jgi:hypothetical protein
MMDSGVSACSGDLAARNAQANTMDNIRADGIRVSSLDL